MDIGMINTVAIASRTSLASLASLARCTKFASPASPAHRGRSVNRARSLTPDQREKLRA